MGFLPGGLVNRYSAHGTGCQMQEVWQIIGYHSEPRLQIVIGIIQSLFGYDGPVPLPDTNVPFLPFQNPGTAVSTGEIVTKRNCCPPHFCGIDTW